MSSSNPELFLAGRTILSRVVKFLLRPLFGTNPCRLYHLVNRDLLAPNAFDGVRAKVVPSKSACLINRLPSVLPCFLQKVVHRQKCHQAFF